MHFSKKASRLWTMFMAVAMCLSLSVPAFAAESPSTEEVSVISSDAQVYSAGNVPVNHRDNPVRGSAVYRITPSKGQVLKLQINNSINPDTSAITVKVTITVRRGQGTTEYTLISNCNGEVYTVEFEADPGYFVGVLYVTTYA